LLKRAFEAFGYNQGDYEDAAHAIVWLEARALNGLELLMRDWERLSNTGSGLEVLSSSDDVQVLDAHASSILAVGRSIADFATASLKHQGHSRVEVRGCYSRIAILPSLDVCAPGGAAAVAYWNDATYQHVAWTDTRCTNPEYRRMKMKPDDNASAATLNLVCHTQARNVDALVTELSAGTVQSTPTYRISPAQMDSRYRAAVQKGLPVSAELVAMLSTAAETMLVPASEQSRRGAGEA
jgi:hypothetical protein